MSPPLGVAFDIGGTHVRGALVAANGEVGPVRSVSSPTDVSGRRRPAAVIAGVVELLADLARAVGCPDPARVVVGFPGPVEPDGSIRHAPTLLGPSDGSDLAAPLREAFGDVLVANDVTCAGFHVAR
jgi:predicted NBD/HSP70 family sugar kinase